MWHFLVTWLVTTISLLILSNLPLGIEIKNVRTAFIGALVLGLLNALLLPILQFLATPVTFITFGLFSFIVSAIVFGLAARLVEGFYLRNGFLSALIGSIVVGLLNSLIFWLF